MYAKLSKLFIILVFVGIVSYLFYFNPQEVLINFGSESKINSPLALALICSFFLGVVLTALSALFFGLKLKFETWRIQKKLRQQNSHYQDLQKVEDFLSLNDSSSARSILNQIINKDSTDILARLALSKSYLLDGNSNQAIKILEEARATEKRSPAILLELAKSYEQNGNKSAALDNILLCLRENPKSAKLIEKVVHLASDMNRLDEAEMYCLELLKVCPYAEQQRVQDMLALTKLKKLSDLKLKKPEEYRPELLKLVKMHKDFEPALVELADDLFKNNEPSQAVKTLQKALKNGHSHEALNRLVTFWLGSNNPSAAIALLKETILNSSPSMQITAQTLLTQLLMQLEDIDQAEIELKNLEELIEKASGERGIVEILKAKLESKVPGRSKTNTSLEKLLIRESKKVGIPILGSTRNETTEQLKPINASKQSLH